MVFQMVTAPILGTRPHYIHFNQRITLTETETETDEMCLKPIDIGLCVCQCEHLHTILYNPFLIIWVSVSVKTPIWLIYIARDRLLLGFLSYREKAAESVHNVAIGFGIRVRVRQCKSAIIRHRHVLWKRRGVSLLSYFTHSSQKLLFVICSFI